MDVSVADRDGEHLRLQPRALARGAGAEAHVFLDPLALLRGVRLLVAPLEAGNDPLEGEHVRPPPAHAIAVGDVDLVAVRPVEEEVLLLLGELDPRRVELDLVAVGDRLDDRLVVARVPHRPGHERALSDGERRVGDEQVGVDLLLGPKAGAARAGAVRGVEGEDARLQLGQADAVLGAREALGERLGLAVDDVDCHEAVREGQRRLDRVRQPVAQIGLHHESVDDHLDRVLELLVELDLLLELALLAVHLHACEALAAQLLEQVAVLPLAVPNDGGVDRELRSLRQTEHLVDDRLDVLPRDGPPADRAVRSPDARVEEAQVVVDLRHRPDRGARVA